MRQLSLLLAVVLAVPFALAAGLGAKAAEAQPRTLDGKAIFMAQKCNMCHGVPAAGIEATTKSEKVKGPDLDALEHDADLLVRYLRKQAEIDGEQHVRAFTGTDEELGALVAWLQKQKK